MFRALHLAWTASETKAHIHFVLKMLIEVFKNQTVFE